MTREGDEVEVQPKIVVTMDICSSTQIIEDLLKRQNPKAWRDLIIDLKEYLADEGERYGAEAHKFIGDGWTMFFDPDCPGKNILKVLSRASQDFDDYYRNNVLGLLDTPPEISGLTFGVDGGQLIKMTMYEKPEYVGRPINLACRLQGAINKNDITRGFRVLMSNDVFRRLNADLTKYTYEETQRPLKNISEGKPVQCYLVSLLATGFRLLDARYGTFGDEGRNENVTKEYANKMRDGTLDIIVSNEVIGGHDPHPQKKKILKVKFSVKGELKEQEFNESSRLRLP